MLVTIYLVLCAFAFIVHEQTTIFGNNGVFLYMSISIFYIYTISCYEILAYVSHQLLCITHFFVVVMCHHLSFISTSLYAKLSYKGYWVQFNSSLCSTRFSLHRPRKNSSIDSERQLTGIFHLNWFCFCGKQVFDGDDSDGESPKDGHASSAKIELNKGTSDQLKENGSINVEKSSLERSISNSTPNSDIPLSMGEILSSLDPGISFAANGGEFSTDKQPIKANGSHGHVKRNNFWGRSNVRNLLWVLVYSG